MVNEKKHLPVMMYLDHIYIKQHKLLTHIKEEEGI